MTVKEQVKAESFEAKFSMPADVPTYKEIKDASGQVTDYLDVKIEGYANTFELDRGGDMTLPGCFLEHLSEYKENPILLADHVRDTRSAVGRVFSAYEDDKGLKVSARLSNAPDVRDLRFKVAEGILKTFSIGGLFHVKYGKDMNYVDKMELREISIVAVPMNKTSLFEVKEDQSDNQRSQSSQPGKTDADKAGAGSDVYIEMNDGEIKQIIQ